MEFDLNQTLTLLLSFILSFIVSFFVAKFYGPHAVEISKRRRDHSVLLNDYVFKPWLTQLNEYCKVGATFNLKLDKLDGIEPKDPTNLKFFNEGKNHLESKYLDILDAWKELKQATFKHNRELATFLEEIRLLIVKEAEMPCYYRGMRGDQPLRYVRPDLIALHIYQIIAHEIHTGKKWFGGKPKVQPVISGDTTFYELRWWNDPSLVKSQEKKEVEQYVPLIMRLVETANHKEKIKTLLKKEDEILRPKREEFKTKMETLIKFIALGNILKGKCQFCP